MGNTSGSIPRTWYQVRFGFRFWGAATLALCLGATTFALVRWHAQDSAAAETPGRAPPLSTQERERLQSVARRSVPLQIKKRVPGENDWLAKHGTEGQSFDAYRATNPNRPSREYTTLYVLPVGPINPTQDKIVATTRELLGIFYGVPTKMLPAIDLSLVPATARRSRSADEQLLTIYLLEDILAPRRPRDAVALLGLTARDLYPADDWNYVFGQATLDARVGIHSFHRYGDPDAGPAAYDLCLLRTLKVAVHETGHMFGLPHCKKYECGMNGSNHVEELDGNMLGFCVECEQKLWWACRLSIRDRYEKLLDFAEKHSLAEQAAIWRAHLARCAP